MDLAENINVKHIFHQIYSLRSNYKPYIQIKSQNIFFYLNFYSMFIAIMIQYLLNLLLQEWKLGNSKRTLIKYGRKKRELNK